MKLTDFVAQYIAKMGVHKVFAVQGGAALHLIDSLEKNDALNVVAMQHEQSSAMAADGYAKSSKVGVTVSTSGPGATNLVTGIACSYFDSVATVHITGNVASFRCSTAIGVRQYGFQETDIVSIVKPITKFAVKLTCAQDILTMLPQAFDIAMSGRKGPVLVDIPDDFQREELDDRLVNNIFSKQESLAYKPSFEPHVIDTVQQLILSLRQAKRPVVVIGAGAINDELKIQALDFCQKQNLPYLITWPVKGIGGEKQLNIGCFGTHCLRGNNLAIQNADFIISLGCRLDSRATAKLDGFARAAKIAMVDLDEKEIAKFDFFGKKIDFSLPISLQKFFILYQQSTNYKPLSTEKWLNYIADMKHKYNQLPDFSLPNVNPYRAIQSMSSFFKEDQSIVIDTGTCLPLTMVYGNEKSGQRYISSFNNTPMGYALPSAIGVALSNNKVAQVICIAGDGGLQMNIQELATISHLGLPIFIIVFNNFGHSMIKQTQDDWLDSNYYASSSSSGLPELNFSNIAKAYGIDSTRVHNNSELDACFDELIIQQAHKPYLLELVINDNFRCEPIIKYGFPLEHISPVESIKQINDDLLVAPYQA